MAYQGPRKVRARFPGHCAECGEKIETGASIVYFPTTRWVCHATDPCYVPTNRKALSLAHR